MKNVKPGKRIAVCGLLVICTTIQADTTITRFTIDTGGVMRQASANIELSGTIGQFDIAVLSNGGTQVTGGFWHALPVGDCNFDGLIDLPDYSDWPACLAGPDSMGSGACQCLDLDLDRDVDLFDAAEFQIRFIGN